eukprot:6192533-Pleurochrysis_carterae.AAC.2
MAWGQCIDGRGFRSFGREREFGLVEACARSRACFRTYKRLPSVFALTCFKLHRQPCWRTKPSIQNE